MSILGDLKMYSRFAWGLRSFLRHPISLEEARAIVRERMAQREDNFLRLVEKGIFGYPRSPYRPLLKLARCELGDIQSMVRARGLEKTLHVLREAGVYVTFEEFKGRQPIIRDGHVFPVQAHAFDNPYLSRCYHAQTGGSTGAGTRVPIDLDHLAAQAPHLMLTHEAHDLLHVPLAVWYGMFPDCSGINAILRNFRHERLIDRWFTPLIARDLRPSLKYRLANHGFLALVRLFGGTIPQPEPVRLDQASVIARWVAQTLKTEGACQVAAGAVSRALRVCIAAREEGLDFTGAVLWGGGEPPTPAKVREMTRIGVRWIPGYWMTEAGMVGGGCARPADGNDIHLFKDALALIQHPCQVPGSEVTVDAFHFTSLLPTAPKLMLNFQSDDYGVIESRSCGCPLESYGFTEHLRHIRSFHKLTGEGVTLVGSEMIQILEEVLPARFGGSSLDYQLLEEEDEEGLTRLNLLVSPRVEIPNETIVVETVLEALRRSSVAADCAGAIWKQAGTLRVKRMEPVWTARGKLMPLHVQRRSESSTHAQAEDFLNDPVESQVSE